jgi:hypothetical protein
MIMTSFLKQKSLRGPWSEFVAGLAEAPYRIATIVQLAAANILNDR